MEPEFEFEHEGDQYLMVLNSAPEPLQHDLSEWEEIKVLPTLILYRERFESDGGERAHFASYEGSC